MELEVTKFNIFRTLSTPIFVTKEQDFVQKKSDINNNLER